MRYITERQGLFSLVKFISSQWGFYWNVCTVYWNQEEIKIILSSINSSGTGRINIIDSVM